MPGPFFSSALSSRGQDTWRKAKPKEAVRGSSVSFISSPMGSRHTGSEPHGQSGGPCFQKNPQPQVKCHKVLAGYYAGKNSLEPVCRGCLVTNHSLLCVR